MGVALTLSTQQSRGYYILTIEQLFAALIDQCNCHPISPPPPFRDQKPNDCAVVTWSKFLDAASTKLFVSGMINLELNNLCEQMMNFCY